MREPHNHHGAKVADLAMNLAKALGLDERDVYLMGVAGQMHDIGKLLIRTDVLNAPRKLTEAERAEMETHTSLGWAVVNEAGYEDIIRDAVRHHHERFDGSGYPDGLVGYKIPLSARVIGICDYYSALVSDRPYREAFSHQFAMAMIQKDKRTIFDPNLVDLFFSKVMVT